MDHDVEMSDAESLDSTISRSYVQHYKIALDFGTTYTSVAYFNAGASAQTLEGHRAVSADDVQVITDFLIQPADEPGFFGQRASVPSVCWYGTASVSKPTRQRKMDQRLLDLDQRTPANQQHVKEAANKLFRYGFEVGEYVNQNDPGRRKGIYLECLKLKFDRSEVTKEIRQELDANIKRMRREQSSRSGTSPIVDYLTNLFRFVKSQLETKTDFRSSHESCYGEFVITVPAAWDERATTRMEEAVGIAIDSSGLLQERDSRNFFIVSEPEAASLCVLQSFDRRHSTSRGQSIKAGYTIVVLDAGGGTVDAACYTVAKKRPLCLHKEETLMEGSLCGSSFINKRLQKLLFQRLTVEDFHFDACVDLLEEEFDPEVELKRSIETAVQGFEHSLKRQICLSKGLYLRVPYLKRNVKKGHDPNMKFIELADWEEIFRPSLQGTTELMIKQIGEARTKGCEVKRVVLVGGFGESRPLREHIEYVLADYNRQHGTKISLIKPDASSTAVARGAVLRALNKRSGPLRHIRFSYGFNSDENYAPDSENPDIAAAHRRIKPWTDPADKQQIVKNTIVWTLQKGTLLPADYAQRIPNTWIFAVKDTKFVCELVIYRLDRNARSHYKVTSEENKGAERIITVSVDMTFLKHNDQTEEHPNLLVRKNGREVWEITLDVVMRVQDRTMYFEACFPSASSEPGDLDKGHKYTKRKECNFSIAGAFEHGTA